MILRLLNIQGMAGVALSLVLGLLLVIQKSETRHWKKQSASFEQLYHQDQAAFASTVINYRSAAERSRAADKANAERVAAEQAAINERTTNDLQARLAAARTAAQRMRLNAQDAADSSVGGSSSVRGLSVAAGRPDQATRENGLPIADALTATEQAIQLDELISWVRHQHAVDPNDK